MDTLNSESKQTLVGEMSLKKSPSSTIIDTIDTLSLLNSRPKNQRASLSKVDPLK